MIKLTIPMKIFPKKRPRTVINKKTGRIHTYTPKDDREANLMDYMRQFMLENRLKPFTDKLLINCVFNMEGKSRSDLDNGIKTIFDCGNGILWEDDKQIKECWAVVWENVNKNSIEIIISKGQL